MLASAKALVVAGTVSTVTPILSLCLGSSSPAEQLLPGGLGATQSRDQPPAPRQVPDELRSGWTDSLPKGTQLLVAEWGVRAGLLAVLPDKSFYQWVCVAGPQLCRLYNGTRVPASLGEWQASKGMRPVKPPCTPRACHRCHPPC